MEKSFDHIFRLISEKAALDWTFTVRFSSLQIYLDKISDCLDPNSRPQGGFIINDDGELPRLKQVCVLSADEAIANFERAKKGRKTAHTKLNSTSSRSHFLVRLHIVGKNSRTGAAAARADRTLDTIRARFRAVRV